MRLQNLFRTFGSRNDEPVVQARTSEFDLSGTSIHDDIAQLAYTRWQYRGCPTESAETDWLEAERTVLTPVGAGPRE